MNGFAREDDYDYCPDCSFAYTCDACARPSTEPVVPDVDISGASDEEMAMAFSIYTARFLSDAQKEKMLAVMGWKRG